jgi:hypothetical protein
MAFKHLVWGVLASFTHEANAAVLQEAVNSSLQVLSKAEIMATMTTERAITVVLDHKRVAVQPKLMAILRELQKGNATMKQVHLHQKRASDRQQPEGYAAVEGARDMLNEMMDDAMAKLDNEVETCGTYNRETLELLEEIRQDVASFNSQAAEARSRVLKAQSVIAFCNTKMPQVGEELDEHNAECTREEAALNTQIDIVEADLAVIGDIMKIIGDCEAAAAGLIQCRHCRKNGEGYVMIQDSTLQPLLDKLKSSGARKALQQSLGELYKESEEEEAPTTLTQLEVTKLRGARLDPNDEEFVASEGNESDDLNISDVPEETVPVTCVPTNKCTLGKGSCPKIRDRFLYIQAGIQDMLDQLKDDLEEHQKSCESVRLTMEDQLANLGEKLRGSQTDLGVATKDQVDSESSSNLKAQQHGEITNEYGKTMAECCTEQNGLKSEICALEKIRGELLKLRGVEGFITDCEVSDFKAGKCSVSCGGGTLVKTRGILVHPMNGMACPPLEMKESCNTHPCPIDCNIGDWEGWSGCSAECGGGLRERMRPVLRQMKYAGEPCEDTEETEGCEGQSCNKNCVLAEWSEWGACTQACWTGTSRRERGVAEEARGTGTCPDPKSDVRLEFRECNTMSCKQFYHKEGRKQFLKCGSKTDMVILMDGSGSLGSYGWKMSKKFVANVLEHLQGGDEFVKVAVQLFSGPTSFAALDRCTGASPDPPNMEKDCGIKWVKHFTNDTLSAAEEVEKLEFPQKSTLTSVALAEAEAELVYGREDATSVVIVITDGKPLSQTRTKLAAQKLMQKARVLWVPVGGGAPYDFVEKLASLPKSENVIRIRSLRWLQFTYFANKVISQTCPKLVPAF